MKYIIVILFMIVSVVGKSQDSTNVTLSVRASDLSYIASMALNGISTEAIYDSMKAKFRVANPPTGNTLVPVTAVTMDWLLIYATLKGDAIALKGLCTSRLETLLRAVNQVYLTGKLDALDTADVNTFMVRILDGRFKLRRAGN